MNGRQSEKQQVVVTLSVSETHSQNYGYIIKKHIFSKKKTVPFVENWITVEPRLSGGHVPSTVPDNRGFRKITQTNHTFYIILASLRENVKKRLKHEFDICENWDLGKKSVIFVYSNAAILFVYIKKRKIKTPNHEIQQP